MSTTTKTEIMVKLRRRTTTPSFLTASANTYFWRTKTRDRKLAGRRLAELRQKIGALKISEEAHQVFSKIAKTWLNTSKHAISPGTFSRKEHYIKGLTPFFDHASIRNVTPKDCDKWVQGRGARLAPETFVHELDVLKSILDFAAERGLILSNPAKNINRRRIISKQIVVPSLAEFQSILATIRESDGRKDSQEKAQEGAALVEFLGTSGARIGEVSGGTGSLERRPARWSDVNFEKNAIFLPGTKTKASPRTIPMNKQLRELLERLRRVAQPQSDDRLIGINSARKCLQTACRKLGLRQFTHHDFRHFFATTCIESGVDIPTVSRWLGHKDGGALAMKRYGHLRQEHSHAMIKRVTFEQPRNVIPPPAPAQISWSDEPSTSLIAKEKAKYRHPWWASADPLEQFWGQLNAPVRLVSTQQLLAAAQEAMDREVLESELLDSLGLIAELTERVSPAEIERVKARTQPREKRNLSKSEFQPLQQRLD